MVNGGTLGLAVGDAMTNPVGHSNPSGPFASTTCTFTGNPGSLTVTVFTSAPDFATVVQAGAGSYANPATPINGVGSQAALYYGTGDPSASATLIAQQGSRLVTVELLRPGLTEGDAQTFTGAAAKLFLAA